MVREIGVGVIGMGWMGEAHSRAYNTIHDRSHDAGDPLGFLSWRFEAQHGLGTLGDLASHVIDMAHFLAGPVSRLVGNREVFITERPIPTPSVGTHYDNTKAIEAFKFLESVAAGVQGQPGFREAHRVARVQEAIIRSWDSERWESVTYQE